MSNIRYNIVFDGGIVPERDPEQVKTNLIRLFKTDTQHIERLLSSKKRTVLKRGLGEAEARRYQLVLSKAGIVTSYVADGATEPAPTPAAEAAQPAPSASEATAQVKTTPPPPPRKIISPFDEEPEPLFLSEDDPEPIPARPVRTVVIAGNTSTLPERQNIEAFLGTIKSSAVSSTGNTSSGEADCHLQTDPPPAEGYKAAFISLPGNTPQARADGQDMRVLARPFIPRRRVSPSSVVMVKPPAEAASPAAAVADAKPVQALPAAPAVPPSSEPAQPAPALNDAPVPTEPEAPVAEAKPAPTEQPAPEQETTAPAADEIPPAPAEPLVSETEQPAPVMPPDTEASAEQAAREEPIAEAAAALPEQADIEAESSQVSLSTPAEDTPELASPVEPEPIDAEAKTEPEQVIPVAPADDEAPAEPTEEIVQEQGQDTEPERSTSAPTTDMAAAVASPVSAEPAKSEAESPSITPSDGEESDAAPALQSEAKNEPEQALPSASSDNESSAASSTSPSAPEDDATEKEAGSATDAEQTSVAVQKQLSLESVTEAALAEPETDDGKPASEAPARPWRKSDEHDELPVDFSSVMSIGQELDEEDGVAESVVESTEQARKKSSAKWLIILLILLAVGAAAFVLIPGLLSVLDDNLPPL